MERGRIFVFFFCVLNLINIYFTVDTKSFRLSVGRFTALIQGDLYNNGPINVSKRGG